MLGKLYMDTAASRLQHSDGHEPPHRAQQFSRPPQPGPRPPGALCPGIQHQQHHKLFFYVPPSRPYLPIQSLQWPVPVPMPVSYYGYPGLGYGMPLIPHYRPNMFPPGFVVPHSHLHLTDYRCMLNPHHYQTITHSSRRSQHKGPTREMTSSEVQTEPLPVTKRTSSPSSIDIEASVVLSDCNSNTPSVPASPLVSPALAVQRKDHLLGLKNMVASSLTGMPPNGSFVIQAEEMRIECCNTPVVLQMCSETTEVSQNVVQSTSILKGPVLQDKGLCISADQWEQTIPGCPEALLAAAPSTGENSPAWDESSNQTDPVTVSSDLTISDFTEMRTIEHQSMTSQDFHLPTDPKYPNELLKMESAVVSEDTLVPSPELQIQNRVCHDETVTESFTYELMEENEVPEEEAATMIEVPPLAQDELKDRVPTLEGPGNEKASEANVCHMMGVAEEIPMTKLTHAAGVALPHNFLLLDNSPLKRDRNQLREMNIQDHQDTSFESLPTYLPSTSRLADFDHVYYCSKMPQPPRKQRKPLSYCGLDGPTRRKLDLEVNKQSTVGKPKVRYKPKSKVDQQSLSDHECCLSRNFSETVLNPFESKMGQLCSSCLEKHRACRSASPGLSGLSLKRKAVPFQQWNDSLLPTSEACKSHKRLMRRGSNPDVWGPYASNTEEEYSENSSRHMGKKWTADDCSKLTDLKKPLAPKQNLEKCPTTLYPKLREKNCVCNKLQHSPVSWKRLRHCPHGNAIHEMDENCAMPVSFKDNRRNIDQTYLTQRWQTAEKSWKEVMTNPDTDDTNNETRSQHLNKHKKSQSQGYCNRPTTPDFDSVLCLLICFFVLC